MLGVQRYIDRFKCFHLVPTNHVPLSTCFYKEWSKRCHDRDFAILEFTLQHMDVTDPRDQDIFVDVVFTLRPAHSTVDSDYVSKVDVALARVYRWVTNMFWEVPERMQMGAIVLMAKLYNRLSDWYRKLPFEGVLCEGDVFLDGKFHMTVKDWCVHFLDRVSRYSSMERHAWMVNKAIKNNNRYWGV